ncbi:MAG TPA: hypothetical protein VGB94_04885, partial [Acidobacteriaceae bacterium]
MCARGASASILCFIFSVGSGLNAYAQSGPKDAATARSFAAITSVTALANGMEVHDGQLVLRVIALRD